MKKESLAAILTVAVLFFCTSLTEASAAPMINDIRFESPSPTADQVIFQLNGPYLPTGKALPGDNPRVYFDFADTAPANRVKNRIPANGNFIKQIRYAYHKGPESKTRVVFDLIANRKMDFRQDFDQDTNTLVITLYPAGAEPDFVAAKSAPEPKSPPVQPPDPVVAEKPAQPAKPKPTMEPREKEEIPAQPETIITEQPAEAAGPEPEPVQATVPEITETPAPQEESPRVSTIPPSTSPSESLATPVDEATVIQPMSEVGVREPEEADTEAPVLHSIEFDPKSNRGEMISFKLNGFHPPVVFGIEEDIPRIVCFFKNASADSEVQDMVDVDGRYVKNIKIGRYENPNNIRVVLELVPGNNYDLQQIFFKDDKIFMMIINKAGNKISTQSN
ncbi:MAG: AMIN domain-containing protein [Desulfobulbaceae bacterium]|nr:AMIN domain-containing protein [Desulfobulbaceae bacterium]